MVLPISVDRICMTLEGAFEKLAAPDREQVQTLLASTSSECRALLFFPIHIHAPVEVWPSYIHAPDPARTAASEHAGGEAIGQAGPPLEPAGWLCSLAPSTAERQIVDLAELLHAFHFFAPLRRLADLSQLGASLVQQLTTLQRICPAGGLELYGDEITFTPPASFGAVRSDVILLSAMSPIDPFPEGYAQYPVDHFNKRQATAVVLYGTATEVVPDAAMRLAFAQ